MKNLKVRTKLISSFTVLVLVFVAVIFVSLTKMDFVRKQFEEFHRSPYTVRGASMRMKVDFESMQKNILFATTTSDVGKTKEYVQLAEDAASQIREEFVTVKERYKGDAKDLDIIEAQLTKMNGLREQVVALEVANHNEQALVILNQQYIPEMNIAIASLDNIIEFANTRADNLVEIIRQSVNMVSIILIICGLTFIVLALFICFYVSASITRPLMQVKYAAERLAEGKLDATITYESRDELGQLADSMRLSIQSTGSYITEIDRVMSEMAKGNFDFTLAQKFIGDFENIENSIKRFVDDISNTLFQIKSAADQVSSGSEQVSIGSQSLAQGATEQASSVEELSASITEISSHVKLNADNAHHANTKANEATTAVTDSNNKMQELMVSMDKINSKSGEISKIIKAIEDIAFQTNILALNAAVEAARAGSAGKGFAVVADEVRNLAGKSAEAAKNTTLLIEDSVHSINEGVQLARITADQLIHVVDDAKETAELIHEISIATGEQSESLAQITVGVDQISAVIQTNSATSEESAAASEELSSQATLLKELVSRFKLRGHSAGNIEQYATQAYLDQNFGTNPYMDVPYDSYSQKY